VLHHRGRARQGVNTDPPGEGEGNSRRRRAGVRQ
jgi:hypothetical protein